MRNLFIFVFLICASALNAQYYKTYDWESTPEQHTLNSYEQKESSVGVLKRKVVEFYQSDLTKSINIYETIHTITKVNDEVGIQRHNQVYIPMHRGSKLMNIKARTIAKDGSITNLNEDNIKQIENVEDYGDFEIFAIEGAQNGSEIEVLYTLEKEYSPFGTEIIQSNFYIKRAEMVYITNNLLGSIKTYNTEQEFERTYLENKLVEELVVTNIKPVAEEEYSATEANRIYVAYQCFGNPDITQELLWSNVVGNISQGLFPVQIQKVVIDEIRKNIMKEGEELSDFEKAARLDNFIKSNFTVVDNRNQQLEEIDYILQNRSASEIGILKVYAHFLVALKLDYEMVITANRYTHRFDPDYYNPNALREFLIYLPYIKQYISPNRIDYRVSEAPTNILGNNGLFINQELAYDFRKIVQSDPDYSHIVRNMDINFSEDFDNVIVDEYQEYYGHWGVQNRAYMALMTGDAKKQFEDYLTGSGIEGKNVTKLELENEDMNQTEYNLPYIVKSTIESSSLLQDAGGSYIFEIGKIIGIQSELYQEKERANPIEMQYPNQYNYEIIVNIPEGYATDGLESLVINKELIIDGKKLCYWNSSYEIKDGKITITIEESYRVNEYPIEKYEGFREVINAASDFNKAAILFTEE
ncbi:hypothetical protein [Urechidicola vernalis]|uniref:DUF3857 domain-containing protein n=1 Tax=Urechidicola vernalis TaxID=3075600 RepID=A0ABU2Y3Y4_9FLAO|nr:hypothetical protein [Urechidicola sp. P050]MDT0552521.1 hypothetical protein [Urechidicola sp. P050]